MKTVKRTTNNNLPFWRYIGYLLMILLILCGVTLFLASCDREEVPEKEERVAIGFSLQVEPYDDPETVF
jgi:hypothetical protein